MAIGAIQGEKDGFKMHVVMVGCGASAAAASGSPFMCVVRMYVRTFLFCCDPAVGSLLYVRIIR
jgi:hypothetical protein